MFEHADRINAIEAAAGRTAERAIVREQDLHREVFAPFLRDVRLTLRHSHARDAHAITLGSKLRRSAPSAADVQDTHARFEPQLAAYQIELCFLRRIQVARIAPIRTAVDHPRIEHALVKIGTDIVMPLADDERAGRRLRIEEGGFHCRPEPCQGVEPLLRRRAEYPEKHFVESFAVPLPVYVSFADPQRPRRERATIETGVA